MKKKYDKITKNLKTILFTLVMLLLIFSFAIWGVADVIRNILSSGNAAVEVDGKKISNSVIDSNYKQYLYMLGQSNNTSISVEEGLKIGALEQSVKKLVSEIALDKEANEVGIKVNDEVIAKQIREDVFFQDSKGNFDQEKFEKIIAYSGFVSEKQFLQNLKQEKARLNLLTAVKSGVQSLNYVEDLLDKYNRELRYAKYIVVPFDKNSVKVTEEELKEYYDKNINSYKTDKLYDVSVLMLKRDKNKNLSEEEVEDNFISQVDLVDTLLAEEVDLVDISSEVGVSLQTFKDLNPNEVKKYYEKEDASSRDMIEILGAIMDVSHNSNDIKTSNLKETNNGDYFVLKINDIKGNKAIPFVEVRKELKIKYVKDQAEENARKEAVDLVKKINNKETTLDNIAKEKKLEIVNSKAFHRLPKSDELKELSPIAIAQLFTKENVGEAGLSILNKGVFLFVLDKIEYEEKIKNEDRPGFATAGNVPYKTNNNEMVYLMVESFANDLLDKYNAKINYKALKKMYATETDQ